MDLKQALVSINCNIHKGEGDDEVSELNSSKLTLYLDESDMIGRTAQQAKVTAPEVHGPLPGSL